MSLADELRADLEDLDDGEEATLDDLLEDDEDDMNLDLEEEDVTETSIFAIAKLSTSEQLTRVLESIDKFSAEPESRAAVVGPVEEDPEYKLIVEANNLTVEIDNEIGVVHKFLRDHYGKRFPELEQLVLHPLDYIRTVKTMQNQTDCTALGLRTQLEQILPASTVMVISVTSSSTQGKVLTDAELQRCLEAGDMGLELNNAKAKIFDYVESRMYFLAPNLTHICNAATAAKMLGAAGGLTKLSGMPSCNVLLLGSTKKALSGFSAAAMMPHTGFVFYCELVQLQPPEYRRKCARLVANKCALAARVDAHRNIKSAGATEGIAIREKIVKTMEKAMAPPPAKITKALPKPDGEFKKKRGGKRVRKMKESVTMSETRKAANRMSFAEIGEDIYQDEMGFDLGQLGKDGSHRGHFRVQETSKRKAGRINKKMAKRLAQQNNRAGSLSSIRGPSAGTSSVAFTPVQGLEINTSHMQKKVEEANAKYFGTNTFHAVK